MTCGNDWEAPRPPGGFIKSSFTSFKRGSNFKLGIYPLGNFRREGSSDFLLPILMLLGDLKRWLRVSKCFWDRSIFKLDADSMGSAEGWGGIGGINDRPRSVLK